MKPIINSTKRIIQDLVNQADPWHLIEMDAPVDEYNSQINKIVSYVINKKPNQADLALELSSVFLTEEFQIDEDKIKKLSSEILNNKLISQLL